MTAGKRNRLISIVRMGGATTNDYGETTGGSDQVIATAFAEVLFGTGQERREAAQEAGSQAITVIVAWTPTLAATKLTDRVQALSAAWDITSVVPVGLNKEIHLTAMRSV
ncbi:MAG: head-tail adaptor protein [Pseudomonadota bacterium]